MSFRPRWEGQPCTLGFIVLAAMEELLASPDSSDYKPFIPTPEQAEFVLRFYEVDRETGRRRIYRRGVYSRPKGAGKSPFMAAIAAIEALGEVVPDGFDASGQPVGKPWWTVRTPWVQLAAVSEDQTRNAWIPLLEMLRNGPVIDEFPGLDPMDTFIALPGSGRIEYVTSSSLSREGNRPVFAVLDQTESWHPGNGGVKLADTLRRNLAKTGGTSIETPNAFVPGDDSVAESSAAYHGLIREGKARDTGLLYDHREAPADIDLSDRDALLDGLRYAYGCASAEPCVLEGHDHDPGWVDIERIAQEVYDLATSPQDARRYYLNQVTHATDAYIAAPEWAACKAANKQVKPGDVVVLGFDGSRGRAKGKPDATALVGCRVSDGHLFELGVWEAPDGPGQESWEPPLVEIDAAVESAFKRYKVVGFYADPAKNWRSKVNEWEARYHRHLKVKVSRDHPCEWWMTGGRSGLIQRAVEAFSGAVMSGDLSHDGSYKLTQHVLNARQRVRRQKLTVGKEHDYSPRKIDACVAAILAWQARLDAVAAGIGGSRAVPKRIR